VTTAKNNRLVVPHKDPKDQDDPKKQATNWQYLERWANQNTVNQIVAGSNVTIEQVSQTQGTGGDGTGVVTVNATGGGGGSITDITSTGGTVIITDPTGPVTNLEVGLPVLNSAGSSTTRPIPSFPALTQLAQQAVVPTSGLTGGLYQNIVIANVTIQNTSGSASLVTLQIQRNSDSEVQASGTVTVPASSYQMITLVSFSYGNASEFWNLMGSSSQTSGVTAQWEYFSAAGITA
jgi:hypothetical protein